MGFEKYYTENPMEKIKAEKQLETKTASFDSVSLADSHLFKPRFVVTREQREVPRLFSDQDIMELQAQDFGPEVLDMEVLQSGAEINRQYALADIEKLYEETPMPEEGLSKEHKMAIIKRRGELAAIRATYQLHTLSASAKLQRDRVIKNLETKDSLKEQLLKSNESLDYVVKTFVSEKEKKRVAKDTKEHLKHFWKFKEALSRDPLMSTKEKARALYNYAKNFASDIEIYKSLYLTEISKGKREVQIEEYIGRFEDLLNYYETGKENPQLLTVLGLRTGSANAEIFGQDSGDMLEKARKKARTIDKHNEKYKRTVELEEDEETAMRARKERVKKHNRSVSKEQQAGLAAADDWLIGVASDSTKRLPFVNRIMKLSARERLFIYHVIETGHLEMPDITDMSISQTTYIPNVGKLKWKMYRVPFRLWEKTGNEGMVSHHWEKLEAALALIGKDEVAKAIDLFANEAEERSELKEQSDQALINGIEDENLRKAAEEAMEARRKRDALLNDTIIAVEECVEALKARDSAWIHWKKKAAIAKEKSDKAIELLNELLFSDNELGERLSVLRYKSSYEEEDVKGELMDHGKYAAGQSLAFMSKLSNVPKLFGEQIAKAGITAEVSGQTAMVGNVKMEGLLNAVNITTGIFATTKGMMGLMAGLKGAKKTIDAVKTGDIDVTDAIFLSAQSLYGIGAAATGVGLGVTSIAYATRVTNSMMTGYTDAIKGMKAGVSKTSMALSGIGLVMNVADYTLQGVHLAHRAVAADRIKKLKKSGALKGDDAKYMDGIMKLDRRNKVKKAMDTTFSTVTNAGTMGSLFLGPAGSLAWAGVSVGLSLANRLSDTCCSREPRGGLRRISSS